MRIEQRQWTEAAGWQTVSPDRVGEDADLVLAFGGTETLRNRGALDELRVTYPRAHLLGCSTAGEITDTHVHDGTIVATAIRFNSTRVVAVELDITNAAESLSVGRDLGRRLDPRGLCHVLLISDGQKVNGSELARGLQENLPPGVSVTGGLAGDGARFHETLVFSDDEPREGRVVALGLYGPRLRIGYGSLGGWDPFGPRRRITRSHRNVLYTLDGQPALALYKRYLGEHAKDLPAAGLLFPLSIQVGDHEIVRTILNVNEKDQSMTFAGDIPQGGYARLMKANFERLVDGAHGAAQTSYDSLGTGEPELAILISCVGRKLVLKQRTEQELEAVREVIGTSAVMAGFYSYGEICPSAPHADCELHNQTMTITTMSER